MLPSLLRTLARPSYVTSSTTRSISPLIQALSAASASAVATTRPLAFAARSLSTPASEEEAPSAAPPAAPPAAPFHYLVNHSSNYANAFSSAHGQQLSLLDAENNPYIAGKPAGGRFAVLLLGGHQHKVTVDDVICSEKMLPVSKWAVGEELVLTDEVLACGSASETLLGVPSVPTARVTVRVEEITHDATVIVFKKRRRKNSRRRMGCRRELTFMRVIDIDYDVE